LKVNLSEAKSLPSSNWDTRGVRGPFPGGHGQGIIHKTTRLLRHRLSSWSNLVRLIAFGIDNVNLNVVALLLG
jgi:hypothetical protein